MGWGGGWGDLEGGAPACLLPRTKSGGGTAVGGPGRGPPPFPPPFAPSFSRSPPPPRWGLGGFLPSGARGKLRSPGARTAELRAASGSGCP